MVMKLSQNKRIVLNTIASYSRTVFAILCGVYSTRWVLMALGQEDFGLFGLIGSLVIFISFLNIQFSSAISRYYAYALGRVQNSKYSKDVGLDDCRSWFSVAVMIHILMPLILLLIGWPTGEYLIRYDYLNIPQLKIVQCVLLWRLVCVSTFVGMLNVPFQAMFNAKQYITELTVYSVAQTLVRTCFVYYMACNPGEWLIRYGVLMCFVAIVPQILICIRATYIFPECRVRIDAMKELWRVRKLGGFAFWNGIGGLGYLASHQCMSIIINKNFGARITGSFSLAQTMGAEAGALSGALQGAFLPAIATAFGAGDVVRMRDMALQVCKFGTLLTLIFVLPMMLEIDELLLLWLKTPPPNTSSLCVLTLLFILIEKLSYGQLAAVSATGDVAKFQSIRGLLRILALPLALIAVVLKFGVVWAAAALPVSAAIVVIGDIWIARIKIHLSVGSWFNNVLSPILGTFIIGGAIGALPRLIMHPSFVRLVVTSVMSVFSILFCGWILVLNQSERKSILDCLTGVITKCFKRQSAL